MSPEKKSMRPMTLPAKKRLHLIGSTRAMMPAYEEDVACVSCASVVEKTLGMEVAPPRDEKCTMSPRKVKGRREGVGGAIEEGVVDDTTERQSEVARANVVEAGI